MNHVCPTCRTVVDAGRMLVDLSTGEVSFDGRRARLTAQQAEILTLLLESYPGAMSYEKLITRINGRWLDTFSERGLKVQVHHIRKALAGMPLRIVCAWGDGYRLIMGAESVA